LHSSHTDVDSVPKRRGKGPYDWRRDQAIARTIDAHMGAASN
jgi:hypothetical protein